MKVTVCLLMALLLDPAVYMHVIACAHIAVLVCGSCISRMVWFGENTSIAQGTMPFSIELYIMAL